MVKKSQATIVAAWAVRNSRQLTVPAQQCLGLHENTGQPTRGSAADNAASTPGRPGGVADVQPGGAAR
jgi:hypothetical protein